jgi:hypothetical protein
MHRLECGVKIDQVVRIGVMAADIVVAQRCNYKAAVKLRLFATIFAALSVFAVPSIYAEESHELDIVSPSELFILESMFRVCKMRYAGHHFEDSFRAECIKREYAAFNKVEEYYRRLDRRLPPIKYSHCFYVAQAAEHFEWETVAACLDSPLIQK